MWSSWFSCRKTLWCQNVSADFGMKPQKTLSPTLPIMHHHRIFSRSGLNEAWHSLSVTNWPLKETLVLTSEYWINLTFWTLFVVQICLICILTKTWWSITNCLVLSRPSGELLLVGVLCRLCLVNHQADDRTMLTLLMTSHTIKYRSSLLRGAADFLTDNRTDITKSILWFLHLHSANHLITPDTWFSPTW